jgi:flagellin
MSIPSLTSIIGTQQPQSIQNASAKLRSALASIASGRSEDSTNVSTATQLQSQTANLKQTAGNLAQASSLVEVASGGAQEIQKVLQELQALAAQASSPALSDANRAQLDTQFQHLAKSIDLITSNTSFDNTPLLNGSLSGDKSLSLDSLLPSSDNSDEGLSIPNLSSSSLLGSGANVLSADTAGQSLTTIASALDQVVSTRADIGSFSQVLDFASANVAAASENLQAAQSTLGETDFTQAASDASLANLQQNAAIALAAQTNKLSPTLLQLIG